MNDQGLYTLVIFSYIKEESVWGFQEAVNTVGETKQYLIRVLIMRVFHNEMFNFIQQKSPTTVSGEMNAIGILFSGGSNPG
ncbi:hypothetical protein [Siminovitchia terrae]|uniref:hypothetical protein n=1 Tax=Siminovitchia terrae TaxID=1914933 RepID=UPI001BB41A0E|nr:hypothetical protein [Siminovitchia terrae]